MSAAGGNATLGKYGPAHFAALGRKGGTVSHGGGRPTWQEALLRDASFNRQERGTEAHKQRSLAAPRPQSRA